MKEITYLILSNMPRKPVIFVQSATIQDYLQSMGIIVRDVQIVNGDFLRGGYEIGTSKYAGFISKVISFSKR